MKATNKFKSIMFDMAILIGGPFLFMAVYKLFWVVMGAGINLWTK